MNAERRSRNRPDEIAVKPVGIYSVDQPKRHVNQRQQNLQLDAGAGPELRIGTRQKTYRLRNQLSFSVRDPPGQLVLVQNPRISNVEKWRKRQHRAGKRDSIFRVQDTLRIAADINNVVKRLRNRVPLRIGRSHIARDKGDRADGAEIEAPDIEVASHEKPLVIRHRGSVEAVDKRTQHAHGDDVLPLECRMEIPEVQRRPIVIYGSAKQPARVFDCRCKARAFDREGGAALRRMAESETRRQRMRMKCRETVPGRSQRLVILRDHPVEVILRRRIDRARERPVHSEAQSDAIPDLERITRKDIESGALLLEVQTVLKT